MSKKWYYVLAILFVACSWVGNVWYYEANQLERTVFLEHHVETREGGGSVFDLYYVEDKRADKTLSSIRIEGYPEQIVTPYPQSAEYQRQCLGKMMVNLNKPAPGKEGAGEQRKEPVLIREITALYSDGTSEQVDIGEIYVWPGVYDQEDQDPISGTSGGSSSDNSGYESAVVSRPLQLTAFSSKLLDIAEDGDLRIFVDISRQIPGTSYRSQPSEAHIELRGEPINEIQLPFQINKGDSIRISHQFDMSLEKSMQVYQLILRTTFLEDGRRFWYGDTMIPYYPSPTDREMTEFVRESRRKP
ncbi:hypothetical protein J14TS5_60990 [Paenibacillus lautus]|uniref:hypothetical protein n=1 Tax=Paenibacillus lautus TaxID=1401 RepID=UPI001B29165B|nr:hypothetical protein [Paenibacillus lautus]GIP01014.1 hypothetical protein J14TS5_60990 [Paenibacillus lautus]